jgi:chromatin remodeling complex protein RSC6
MTKQSKTSTSTSAAKVSVSSTVEAAAKAAVEQVKKSASRPKAAVAASAVVEPVPVVSQPSTVQESVVESAAEASSVGDGSRKRRQVTREDLERSFDSLLALLDGEVESLRSDEKVKGRGVRFLRTVAKQVRQLKTDSMRVSSKRVRRQTAPRSTNSGFMKPVKISRDMQKFTGLGDDQLVSRVDVTKSICQYVKTQNLQNQQDRRQFTPDDKLGKLLGTREPLTYYNLQKHIQHHFIKTVPVTAAV